MIWLVVAACAGDANPLLSETVHPEPVPVAIVDACDLARTRCSHCHTLDRIVHARFTQRSEWQGYVHRMRLMPGSAIRPDEEGELVSCFVFRITGTGEVK